VSDERLREVLDDLSLGGWLASLPAGLDTILDAGEVSAGQAQLIAFARIFLHDPGLVVLDEASSRLDPVTEALVDRAVERLLSDRTAVIIAHRLHTLDRVDDVLVLGDGQVLEHGDRRTLAADPTSRFAGLLRSGMDEALA
jgi:ATP-binding cassette, subfamily B, bacterial